jgi:FkbM family methyltransferase
LPAAPISAIIERSRASALMGEAVEPMISYSQNFEDVVLDRVFRDTDRGFYVDVGANDPNVCSVTRHFYESGWNGINIEPGLVFEKLVAARPRDVNLQLAASNHDGDVPFYEFPGADGLAGLSPEVPEPFRPLANRRFVRTVRAVPLRAVLAQHAPSRIDFLSIDVEGHEREVLLGNDWNRFRPRVVLVEATLPATQVPCHDRWEDVLIEAGYLFTYFDGLNRFYVRREDEHLLERFAAPPNVFDQFVPAEVVAQRDRILTLEADLKGVSDHRDELIRAHDRLAGLLAERDALLAGTGGRSLAVGLWVARTLSRLRALTRVQKAPARVAGAVVRSWRVAAGRTAERSAALTR